MPNDNIITKIQACDYMPNFIAEFYLKGVRIVGGCISGDAGNPMYGPKVYNNFPVGFFPKENFEEMLDREGTTGVRYFFGYDAGAKANKIRIALVGVDDTWENVVSRYNKTEAISLEKS